MLEKSLLEKVLQEALKTGGDFAAHSRSGCEATAGTVPGNPRRQSISFPWWVQRTCPQDSQGWISLPRSRPQWQYSCPRAHEG